MVKPKPTAKPKPAAKPKPTAKPKPAAKPKEKLVDKTSRPIVIDGTDHIAGRLSSNVAKLLLEGNRVTVVNSEKIMISGMIDLSQFVLEKDKSVIGLFADCVVTDHDGNLFDACSYAAVAAIITSKIPKWEMKDDKPVLIENQESDAPTTTIPVSVTMGRIGEFIIVDPNLDEWGCLDARITITTNSDGNIVAVQKGGSDGFTFEQLVKCSELSVAVGKKIRDVIKQATESGK